MSSGSDRDAIVAAYNKLDAAYDEVAALSYNAVTVPERLTLLHRLEEMRRRPPAVEHALIQGLLSDIAPVQLGAKNWSEVLQQRLRISAPDALRRLNEAQELGPRTTLTGELLEPLLPHVAKRQAAGELGGEHVHVIRKFLHNLPAAVDYQTRAACGETLSQVAAEHTPDVLRKAADRLAALVNPDGQFDDIDRARRRHVTIHNQGVDGMSKISGLRDPELRATLDAVFAKLAAPGMCNSEDDTPCIDSDPYSEAKSADTRSQSQRNHDALKAMGRSILASGELGQHNGLPVTIIVSTTLQELESETGHAVTGGGTLLPMRDVIRLASHAHHYLSVFDKHAREALYLGRSKRLASAGQRIVLHAVERGCTKPGCTTPAYLCQVHHAELDWAEGGLTNITDETLACGPRNRLVMKGGWRTRKRRDGTTEWIPPPHLDSGQSRINNHHHPERYLIAAEEKSE